MLIGVAVALAASCGVMLPVGTVPNALVFGTGYIALPQMVRPGFHVGPAWCSRDHRRHRACRNISRSVRTPMRTRSGHIQARPFSALIA